LGVVASYWRWRENKEFSSLPSGKNIAFDGLTLENSLDEKMIKVVHVFQSSGVVDIIRIYNAPLIRRFCVQLTPTN
jgi:hypothetical protein